MAKAKESPHSSAHTQDFQQLQLHFADHVQWSYELIRPLVLFEDSTSQERAQVTGVHARTVRRHLRFFRQQGMRGLVPELRHQKQWSRVSRVPEEIVAEVLRLKRLHEGFSHSEMARIIFVTKGYPIHHRTIKGILCTHPLPAREQLLLLDGLDYRERPSRYQARVQIVKLFYQGWGKQSISQVLRVSRPTIDRILQRFHTEHFAGLENKTSAPKNPARKVDLSLMVQIYHLQREHPDAGEFRIWSLLRRTDISTATVGRITWPNQAARHRRRRIPTKPNMLTSIGLLMGA
jgi:transposase